MMSPSKKKNLLFFINGNANAEQIEYATKNGLKIRNAEAFSDDDSIEPCDGVVGKATPDAYKAKFPALELKDKEPASTAEIKAAKLAADAKAKADADADAAKNVKK